MGLGRAQCCVWRFDRSPADQAIATRGAHREDTQSIFSCSISISSVRSFGEAAALSRLWVIGASASDLRRGATARCFARDARLGGWFRTWSVPASRRQTASLHHHGARAEYRHLELPAGAAAANASFNLHARALVKAALTPLYGT
jgi:hypothetical protein